jgi:hypothetical protein
MSTQGGPIGAMSGVPKPTYDISGTAETLGPSESTFRRLTGERHIPVLQIGRPLTRSTSSRL